MPTASRTDKSRGWRTSNSLAIRIDGNGANYWVLYEYGTQRWLTGGEGTFEGRYQTTKTKPFAADGTLHQWTLSYDPAGNSGDGLVTFILDGQNAARQRCGGRSRRHDVSRRSTGFLCR